MFLRSRLAALLAIAAGVALVAACARVSVPIPGSPVPQSLQTLAVVLVGAVLGPARAALCLIAYVVVGAVGVPVFADGAAGPAHLRGPTAGYLAGFVAGAAIAGTWSHLARWRAPADASESASGAGSSSAAREALAVLVAALLAHAAILGFGWLRLAGMMTPGLAFTTGVAPFLVGGVAKSALAAAAWLALRPILLLRIDS